MNPHRLLRIGICSVLVAAGLQVVAATPAAAAPVLPAQFTDSLVAGGVSQPTAIAFLPDGRMLVTTQPGLLRVVKADTLLPTPALDLGSKICNNSERGLLGVAADPDASSKAIYLFYTAKGAGSCASGIGADAPRNRVSKFLIRDDNTVDPASENILLDGIYSTAGNHNAGDLAVGKDGNLYVSTGDGGCDYVGSGCAGANDASRDRFILNGKILRITRSGGIPPGNPFTGAGTASCKTGPVDPSLTCQEAFAVGLRNPFRFAFDPNAAGTRFRINDVGQNRWEEIDDGVAGADYGWNEREGHCANTDSETNCGDPKPAQFTDPIADYGHSTGCASITGGAFVPNSAGWPAPYAGGYLFGDYVCGKIFLLDATGKRTEFVTNLGSSSAVHLEFGPYNGSQALYYTSYSGGGEIRRISYAAVVNRTPTAVLKAAPASGPAPLTTTLDGTGSSDPDGDPLSYIWSFGDGTADVTTSTATQPHTYAAGSYTATLRVADGKGATSAPVTTQISSGNTAPTVTITAPGATDLFTSNTTYVLKGTATDAQDGPLPDTRLTWNVIKHHDQHTHPLLTGQQGNNISIIAPEPEDLLAATNSYLEIQLTATDSSGLSTTVSQNFQPRKVAVTLATSPAGRSVTVNGSPVPGPTTVTSWAGAKLTVAATSQTDTAGRTYALDSWSDAGAPSHTYVTPASPATLTASFSLRGLQGAYFDNQDFTGTRVDRLDATVGFDWAQGSPQGIGADTFSARWTGQIQPRYAETYTFSTTSDDGIRLWVDGKLLIDQWNDHAATVHSATAALSANTRYAIAIEYYENGGFATAQLRWASPSQPAEIVPAERLFPSYAINFQPANTPVPPGYTSDSGAAFTSRAGLSSGWNADNSAQTRDRNSSASADQRYDTLIHLQKPALPNASWEIAVPNGSYQVRVVSGDATAVDSVFATNAEKVPVVNGTPTSAKRWLDGSATVTVTDGRLTLTNGAGATNNKIDFVEIALR